MAAGPAMRSPPEGHDRDTPRAGIQRLASMTSPLSHRRPPLIVPKSIAASKAAIARGTTTAESSARQEMASLMTTTLASAEACRKAGAAAAATETDRFHAAVIGGSQSAVARLIGVEKKRFASATDEPSSHLKKFVGISNEAGMVPLGYAAFHGHVGVCKVLLANGADATARDAAGCTALHYAAFENKVKVIKILLDSDADPMARDSKGRTPLHLCPHRHDTKGFDLLVDSLLAKDMDIEDAASTKDDSSMTPLHYAALFGSVKHTACLVNMTPAVSSDVVGRLPLHWAVDCPAPSLPLVMMLLDITAETSLNYRDGYDRTPLMYAAMSGSMAVVKAFLARRDLDHRAMDKTERRAIHLAAQAGHRKILDALLGKPRPSREYVGSVRAVDDFGWTLLHYAVHSESVDAVKHAKKKMPPGSINTRDKNGQTLLMLAAADGNLAMTKFLLKDKEIDVTCRNALGCTALHIAADVGSVPLCQLLVKAGCDLEALSNAGLTPTFQACESGREDAVDYLKSAGADMAVRTKQGRTLLHAAALSGKVGLCATVISDKTVDPRATSHTGKTVLHDAVSGPGRTIEVLELLLGVEPPIDRNAVDAYRMSMLHILAAANDAILQTPEQLELAREFVERILQAEDIEVNAADYKGMFPLDYAIAIKGADDGKMAALLQKAGAVRSKDPAPAASGGDDAAGRRHKGKRRDGKGRHGKERKSRENRAHDRSGRPRRLHKDKAAPRRTSKEKGEPRPRRRRSEESDV